MRRCCSDSVMAAALVMVSYSLPVESSRSPPHPPPGPARPAWTTCTCGRMASAISRRSRSPGRAIRALRGCPAWPAAWSPSEMSLRVRGRSGFRFLAWSGTAEPASRLRSRVLPTPRPGRQRGRFLVTPSLRFLLLGGRLNASDGIEPKGTSPWTPGRSPCRRNSTPSTSTCAQQQRNCLGVASPAHRETVSGWTVVDGTGFVILRARTADEVPVAPAERPGNAVPSAVLGSSKRMEIGRVVADLLRARSHLAGSSLGVQRGDTQAAEHGYDGQPGRVPMAALKFALFVPLTR